MSERKLIKGVVLITEDAKLGILHKGDLLIEDDKIAKIAPVVEAADSEIIDGTNMIAIPGFCDGHRHNWESLIRSVGVDWTLPQYMMAVKKMLGPQYTAEDQYLATYLGALECLDCGITTLLDYFHNNNGPEFADATVQGLEDAGIRCVLGLSNSVFGELYPSSLPMDYEDFRRVRKQYFSSENRLLSLALASRGPQFEDMDLVLEELELARELGVFVVMHVGDGEWGKYKPIKKMDKMGLLKDLPYTFIHCNTLSDEELQIIGGIGSTTVSCPEVELNMGHGFLPTLRLLKAGVQPALGIDVCTSIPGDMFGSMRMMLAGVRAVVNNESLLTGTPVDALPLLATDVLRFATQNGANACKLGDKVGSLTPGKQADIVLIDTNSMNLIPMNSPVGAVVEAAHAGNVDTVFVDGKIVKRNKKLVGVDVAALRKRIDMARDALFARANIPTTGDWIAPQHDGKPPVI